MNHMMKKWIAGLLALLVLAGTALGEGTLTEPEERAVLDSLKCFFEAWNQQDPEAMASACSRDWLDHTENAQAMLDRLCREGVPAGYTAVRAEKTDQGILVLCTVSLQKDGTSEEREMNILLTDQDGVWVCIPELSDGTEPPAREAIHTVNNAVRFCL